MGNKPSVSEGEEDSEDRPLKSAKSIGAEIANGGAAEDGEDEVELPPPMKPIQEPILPVPPTVAPVPGVAEIEDGPGKRVRKKL